jgi:hypothetical protein
MQHVVARHGGERVSEQGTLISADERGMAEVLSLLALLVQKCVYLIYWYKSTKVQILTQKALVGANSCARPLPCHYENEREVAVRVPIQIALRARGIGQSASLARHPSEFRTYLSVCSTALLALFRAREASKGLALLLAASKLPKG